MCTCSSHIYLFIWEWSEALDHLGIISTTEILTHLISLITFLPLKMLISVKYSIFQRNCNWYKLKTLGQLTSLIPKNDLNDENGTTKMPCLIYFDPVWTGFECNRRCFSYVRFLSDFVTDFISYDRNHIFISSIFTQTILWV